MKKALMVALLLDLLLVASLVFVIQEKKRIEDYLVGEIKKCNPSFEEK